MHSHTYIYVALLTGALALAACGRGKPLTAATPDLPAAITGTEAAASTAGTVGEVALPTAGSTPGTPTRATAPAPLTNGAARAEGTARGARGEPNRTRPVAVVEGEPIEWEELYRILEERDGGATLAQLVNARLIGLEGRRRGIVVSDEEVERELARRNSSLPQGKEAAQEVEGRYGTGEPRDREQVRLQLVLYKLIEPEIAISEAEMREYYEANKQLFARPAEYHLLRVVADSAASARAARKALVEGASAEAVMRKHASKRPGLSDKSGDLSWMPLAQMSPQLAAYVSTLEEGDVSMPIRDADGGYSVIQALGVRGGDALPYERIREEVGRAVLAYRAEGLAPRYLADLRRQYEVSTQLPLPDAQEAALPEGEAP